MRLLQRLLSSDFLPHGTCYLWNPHIVWLHVGSDAIITFSYYSIPLALVYFVRKRRDLPFDWIIWLFALFILGCGTTHLMEIWTVWHPTYLLSGIVKAATASVSLITAIVLVPLIPKAATLPSPTQMEAANQELQRQIAARAQRERELTALAGELEQRVQQRTAELERINLSLEKEIALGVKTQQELRASQSRLSSVLESAMDAILTVDDEQHIVMFNHAAEKLFACNRADAIGHSIDRFIPERFRAAHAEHLNRFGATGITSRRMGAMGQLWGLRADGTEFPIEASISHAEAAGKKLFTVILRDITERIQAEARTQLLANIVESSDDAIVTKDLSGNFLTWNKGAERLYGYTEQEVIGKPISLLVPKDHWQETAHFIRDVGQGEKVVRQEAVRLRKNGSQVEVSLTLWPIKNKGGSVIGISSIARDITERKRAAEVLARQSEELSRSREALENQTRMLKSVLDSMAEGLVAADRNGKFLIWNRAAERILGYGPTDLPMQEWARHYGSYLPDRITLLPMEQLPLVRAFRGEPNSAEIFIRNPKIPDGAWIEVSAAPLKNKQGKVLGGVVAFREITRRKTDEMEISKLNNDLEQRVAERTSQLQAANKELEAFTYSVSHDLRAPLRHVAGFSKMLAEEAGESLPPQSRHYLQRIEDGIHRMGLLIDDLLTLTRIGRHEMRLQVTGLHAIVKNVIAELAPDLSGRDIEWTIGELPFVEGDSALLRVVFQNLLSNAVKYSRPRARATIEVGCDQNQGEQVIYVRDNGVGFDMKYAEKLFGVFQRLHRTEDFEGTGVGLATVQRIVQKHGGRIWAHSEPDRGATFWFTLRRATEIQIGKTEAALAGEPR